MADSIARLHPDCVTMFNEFKNVEKPKYDFLIMRLDGLNIVPDLCPNFGYSATTPKYSQRQHPAYDYMVDHLIEKGSGYAFYILPIDTPNGPSKKIIFFTYVDDNGPAKTKMTITSNKSVVEKGCPDFSLKITANSLEDLTYKSCLDAVAHAKSI